MLSGSHHKNAYSSFSSTLPSIPTNTVATKANRHSSPFPPNHSYLPVRKLPRSFSSIEHFHFKSMPALPAPSSPVICPLPSSPDLIKVSSIDTPINSTSILVKQSRRYNENAAAHELETFCRTTKADLSTEGAGNITTVLLRPPSDQQSSSLQHQRQRNYHSFPGNHIFFCGGRLMTSRAYWAFLIAWVLLVVPSVLFGIFTCPFLWANIHPVIPLLFAYLFFLAVASMLKTSWTDPGVLPRGLEPSFDNQSSISTSQPLPLDRCVKIKDGMWSLKYCSTCQIYRPPRASHCRQCDNCVENEDHHCIWLNNCIGKRNYRPFFTFITTCTVMAIYIITFSVVHLLMAARRIRPDIDFDLVFQTTPVSFVLAIVGFFLLWMVGGLTLYHCHLIWKGLTTHEKLRSTLWEDIAQPNPYALTSPMLNVIHILCRPQPKSHLRRRKYPDTP